MPLLEHMRQEAKIQGPPPSFGKTATETKKANDKRKLSQKPPDNGVSYGIGYDSLLIMPSVNGDFFHYVFV